MAKWYDESGKAHTVPLKKHQRINGNAPVLSSPTPPAVRPSVVKPPEPPKRRIFDPRADIAVITCFFNPCGFKALRRNYDRFARELEKQGAPLYTVEAVAPGSQPSISGRNVIHVESSSSFFVKENLLNLAAALLPDHYRKVAFLDCDFIYGVDDWLWETSYLLDRRDVAAVQLMRYVIDLDPKGAVERVTHSIGHQIRAGRPGGGWATRREIFTHFGGLYDRAISGGGDAVHTFSGFLGETDNPFLRRHNPAVVQHMLKWALPVYSYVRGQVTCISADAAHLWHGTRENRRYVQRHRVLLDLDPEKHFAYNPDGVLEWSSEAPEEMVSGMNEMMRLRAEDFDAAGNETPTNPESVVFPRIN